jgi:tetratricopeptide (TPR) repeat protein
MTLRDQLQQTLGSTYTLERELGGGGMSRVFLAEDRTLGRKIVVKVLPPELTAGVNVERFNREILLAAKLQHPHIVPVHSAGEMDGLPWFTMPFVEGESLRARLGRGAIGITESVSLLRDVAKALAYAHERGIVHRDIKPDNILITGGSATVADFGIAKAISASRTQGGNETLTQVGTSIGTPTYMSPEQAAGDPETDHRADIYSFGCVAYEMLAGRPPFVESTPRRLLTAHMAEKPQPIRELRPDAPAALADLVMRCLEKESDARPQRASDLVRVLESVTTGEGTQPAAPAMLLGDAGMMRKALAIYALAFGAVAIVARAAIVGIGLPSWVFPGALIVMALGLPVILWTGYVQRVTRKAFASTPTLTPGGTPQLVQGTMATMALKAAPHVSWRRTARGGMIAMAAFVLLVGGFMVLRALGIGPAASLFAAGSLNERDRLLMTDFTVSGADSSLGRVVSDAVRAGLVQSQVLTLMTPSEIAGALQRMERPVTGRVDLALARTVGQREGVKAIVDGDVTMVGASYIVAVKLVTADSGEELTSFRATAAGPADIITVADELSRKLRSKAGESLRAVNAAPPLARVTTASLEALRKYSEGSRANNMETDYPKAVRLLREAVAIDSLFAEAWRLLGVAMGNIGMPSSETDPMLTRAFGLRDRLTEGDRLRVIGTYYRVGPGRDRAKAIEAYERLFASGDSTSMLYNLALAYVSRREFARSESISRAAVRRGSTAINVSGLIFILAAQGKWTEAESALTVARARFPGNRRFLDAELQGQLLRGNLEAYRRSVDSALRVVDPSNPSGAVFRAAGLAVLEGRLGEWRSFLAQAWRIDSTVGVKAPPIVLTGSAVAARIEMQLPFDSELKAYEEQLKKTPLSSLPATDGRYLQIVSLFARAGRVQLARAAMDEYEKAVTDTSLRRVQQPALHGALGEIASAEGRWQDAVREIRKSDSLPDGPANSCAHCLPLTLLRVFAQAGMADSALAQYEAYLKTPQGSRPRTGPDIDVPAPTMEAVARMYEQRGDTARAVQAYRDFLEIWKRADPELQPRVAAARKRLEALVPVERPRR